MRALELAVTFVLGLALAALCVEVIGLPLLVISGWLAIRYGDELEELPELLVAFGGGFTLAIVFLGLVASGITDGGAGAGTIVWFLMLLALGVGTIWTGAARLNVHRAAS